MKRLILSHLIFLAVLSAGARQIIVPHDQSSVQKAMDLAGEGDTVLVEEGRYFENINFKGKAITVASRFILDRDTSHISRTILDGSRSTRPDTGSVVVFWSGEDSTSVLSGFTITGGSGSIFHTNWGDAGMLDEFGGGGIVIANCGGKITNNIIEENHLSRGDSKVICGAGIYANSRCRKSCIIRNNVIRNNSIKANLPIGTAIFLISGRHVVEGNILTCNLARGSDRIFGGTLYWAGLWDQGTICDVIIRNNSISNNQGICPENIMGGTVALWDWLPGTYVKFCNNIVANNLMEGKAGGIYVKGMGMQVSHNTLWNNFATRGANSFYQNSGYATALFNNILWSDSSGTNIEIGNLSETEITAFHNIMNDRMPTGTYIVSAGNLYHAPTFEEGSFQLAPGSPGIGWGVDILPAFKQEFVPHPEDFAGNPRPDPVDGHIDIGALESSHEAFVFIPDTSFLHELIITGVDKNGDGLITFDEAQLPTEIDVSGSIEFPGMIEDLTGIEAFENLVTFHCKWNQVDQLDVSGQISLVDLQCSNNRLTKLFLPKWAKLSNIDCGSNFFTELDVSGVPELSKLCCSANKLKALDISKNPELRELCCYDNELKVLDASENQKLEKLVCHKNLLTCIDSRNLPELRYFRCADNQLRGLITRRSKKLSVLNCCNNQLIKLDLSQNPELAILCCSGNRFTSLDISENTLLGTYWDDVCLDISDMPGLVDVCVWEQPFPPAGLQVDTTGSPLVHFGTACEGQENTGMEEDNIDGRIFIYPNPVISEAILEIPEGVEVKMIEIMDMQGRIVRRIDHVGDNKVRIQTVNLNPGMYFLNISSAKRHVIKLIIQ